MYYLSRRTSSTRDSSKDRRGISSVLSSSSQPYHRIKSVSSQGSLGIVVVVFTLLACVLLVTNRVSLSGVFRSTRVLSSKHLDNFLSQTGDLLGGSSPARAPPLSEERLSDGRQPPHIPTGPPTELYRQHQWIDVDYALALDTSTGFFNFHNATATQMMQWAEEALTFRSAWIARVLHFRSMLARHGLNNVDSDDLLPLPLQDAPFRNQRSAVTPENLTAIVEKEKELLQLDGPPDLKAAADKFERILSHADNTIARYKFCLEQPSECGSSLGDVPVVVDWGLVIPLNVHRFNVSWPTLESIRQLVVYPKEIIFVIGGVAEVPSRVEIFSYLNLLREVYGNFLPPSVVLKVFLSDHKFTPGENRWFGFNQTTASVVTFFDGDDYLHPQIIQILYSTFQHRPELDYALISYDPGTMEGDFRGYMYYEHVLKFLMKRSFTQEEVEKIYSYPSEKYEEVRQAMPTWNKTWYLGNTDAEPNWGGEEQRWWDYGCHNGWTSLRRHVMKYITPVVDYFGGEDAIFNFRIVKAGFNYKCLRADLGIYLKCFCEGNQQLWSPAEFLPPVERPSPSHDNLPVRTVHYPPADAAVVEG